jgi:4-hydroxy-4-methyl-2-oxoglutarate aldolase
VQWSEARRRLWDLDGAALCDVDRGLSVMDPAIRLVQRGLKLVGRACPVRCDEDYLSVWAALADAGPDDTLVIDASATRNAVAGELFATEALRRGLAGIVIDGNCRDTATLRRLRLPVFARGATPRAGVAMAVHPAEEMVNCGGVVVHRGDVLVGDDDGVVVVPVEALEALMPAAEDLQRLEGDALRKIQGGASLLDLAGYGAHRERLARGEPSSLLLGSGLPRA